MSDRPITIAILAMGGEGGGVLADWIVDLAEHARYRAQTTSVPGVAQRTGSTIYYLELFPESDREPVLALMPVPGELDIVVASELMEAGRAVERGFVTAERTTLIASSHRVYSMTERTDRGDGRVDSAVLIDACRAAARRFICDDFARLAAEHASVISAALFGALAAAQVLPFDGEQFAAAIRRGGVGVESSLKAFAAAAIPAPASPAVAAPPDCEAVIRLGARRLTEYQDAAYADRYLQLLAPIREIGDADLLRETARYLALWMSYEDAIRVADLKTRRDRFERLRREARLSAGQVLRVREFLHPRSEELADILPAWLGRRLLRTGWARRAIERLTHGGMLVETTSVSGFLQLIVLAKLRRFRRRSLRFEREHAAIRQWLDAVAGLARVNRARALEVAQYPRLRRGYGDTYERGCREFDETLHDALSS
jgi:indolepyruvate ferredoxin oxidoreductase beta subunit